MVAPTQPLDCMCPPLRRLLAEAALQKANYDLRFAEAVEAVRGEKMRIREAARFYKVPYPTLRRRAKRDKLENRNENRLGVFLEHLSYTSILTLGQGHRI